MYPPTIQKLIDLFSKFPTVGPRTAARFVFYLLKLSKEEIEGLISAISNLKSAIKICPLCFNPFQSEEEPSSSSPFAAARESEPAFADSTAGRDELCQICANPSRDKSLLCVVEKETDLISIEKTKKYKGLYFILGGTVSALKKANIEKLRTKELEERVKNHPEIEEIIIAINPTTEGEATALYLERLLKKNLSTLPTGQAGDRQVTRLGRGLPVGGELEYADEETLASALEGRK